MQKVISKDGTPIAYDRAGSGPPLVLVDGALCSRAFGTSPRFVPQLARHFTVFAWDRRGRGDSGDTAPYAKEREIEDLEAVIAAAGGAEARVVGFSSGAALALEAAAAGVPMRSVLAYEPPYVKGSGPGVNHEERLHAILAAGGRGKAVTYFMRDMVGAPAFVVTMMKLMPWVWRRCTAVAHTLPYDAAVMGEFTVPASRLAAVATPAWILNGSRTDERLKVAARLVAGAIPGAGYRVLPGQTHNVSPRALEPTLLELAAA